MKKKYRLLRIIVPVILLLSGFACSEDFLNRPPQDALTLDNFYQTSEQVNASTASLYGWPWFDLNDKAHWVIGDATSGNHWTNDGDMAQFYQLGVTQNNPRLNEAWNSLFRVIAHSNMVINNIPTKAGASVPAELKNRVVGEAKFMRATAYFYLVRLWGPVPIIENNSAIVFDSKIPRNTVESVYQFIINDLTDAAGKLPASYSGNDRGRVTKWAAEGMLAKVYLTRSGWGQSGSRNQADLDKAKELAGDVINSSGLKLKPEYADLFLYKGEDAEKDNQESLFAFQWIPCQGWGTQNTNQAYWAKDNTLTGVGDGWGGYIGPTIDLQNEYEPGDKRRHETIMQDGDYYPELKKKDGGYTFVAQPNDNIGENACFAAIKKYVIGTPEDNNGKVCFMSTGINTYVLRLADVYLIYAEAVLGNNSSTSDADALAAFNAVRTRAGLDAKTSITFQDIFHERRVEFAYEADFWYDLIRWHYWNPTAAIAFINNQERGTYYWQGTTRMLNSFKITATDDSFVLPIPASETDQNPKLLDPPVPYNFGK
ncbi:MAG: RagB/SusD family nutrient uptake outer membrane protein [Bacteroidales bacterium]